MSIEPKDDFTTAQTVQDLERARHLIAKGWCRGQATRKTWFLGRMQFCATAAIAEACKQDICRAMPAVDALHQAAIPMFRTGRFQGKTALLQGWNDMPHRSKADILAAFDRAIASLRA